MTFECQMYRQCIHTFNRPVLNDDFSVSSSAENELSAQERDLSDLPIPLNTTYRRRCPQRVDSDQTIRRNTSSIGQPPTPSPRRKTSASSFSEVPELHYDQNNRTPIYVPGNYVEYKPSHGVEDVAPNHGGYFGSNYFPYRPEVNSAFERDYRSYPEYSYEGANYHKYAVNSPRIPRMPSKIPMGVNASNHRRTLSNISSTSSNINPGFRLDSDDVLDTYQFNNLNLNNATSNRMHVYENIPYHQPITKDHHSHQ
ncbi:hypothetical protein HA402_005911 [Bradysia odoriphaga]|nr:hypothetical protein HA402_005911 [Bradysia odoriphaga]